MFIRVAFLMQTGLVCGVRRAACGVRREVCGVRCTACGMRCAASGMRCVVGDGVTYKNK